MLNLQRWANAIQEIESGGRVAVEGDDGQALGNFQFHTTTFWQWAPTPVLGETWAEWFRDTALAFARAWVKAFPDGGPTEMAVVYHRHGEVVRASAGDWAADDYAARFKQAFGG